MTDGFLTKQRSRLERFFVRRGAISLPVALLAGVIGLAAVLAYQAQDAARSDQRRAEATLRDYSAFAASEYARQLRVQAFSVLRSSLAGVVSALNGREPFEPDAAWLAKSVANRRATMVDRFLCDCLDSVRFTFRVGLADSSVAVAPADPTRAADPAALPSRQVTEWVRDTVVRHMARLESPGPMRLQTYGAADVDSPRFGVFFSNDSYVMLVGEPDGVPRLLAYIVARDIEGKPLAVYGYESEPRTWLVPVLRRALDEERLLPPSLMRGLRNEQALALTVRDHDGHEFYRSSPRYDDRYAATDTLPGRFGDLHVQLAIYPEIAPQLLVGGLPTSRLPLLLALFILTAALSLVALLQMRRQQELASLRTDFVSGVSHELRTPLAQIRWFAELLRMGKLRSPDERDRSLRIIDQESRRLHFLVENVLNFSRAAKGVSGVKPEVIPIADEVTEVVDSFLPLAQARHARVITAVEGGVQGIVDRGALRQILLNLLDNAVKYGPTGQTIQVGIERVAAGRVRLWVEDEGPGIPEEERDRIWDAFYRARRDLGSTVTGSGIGLSVVNELVLSQNGRRWVERGEGGGARFVVEFPAPPPPPRAPAAPKPRAAQRPSPTQAFEVRLATPSSTAAVSAVPAVPAVAADPSTPPAPSPVA